jgi:DNA polymerase-3 subunit chi
VNGAACRVEFHTGLADPLAFACRLLRKAQRGGHRLSVMAPAERLAALDELLWTFDPLAFVPHVRLPCADTALLARTPIWLAGGRDQALAQAQATGQPAPAILVNLGLPAPRDLGDLERLVEIVGIDVDEAQAARARWRAYKAAGHAVEHLSTSG